MSKRVALLILGVLTVAVLAFDLVTKDSGPRSGSGPRQGDALEQTAHIRYGVARLKVGDEMIVMMMPLRNISEAPITVIELRPRLSSDFHDVARVVDIELAPRGGGRPPIVMGEHRLYPPAELLSGGCVVQEVVGAEGRTIEPSRGDADRHLLVIRIKGASPGETDFKGVDVFYEQGGNEFQQRIDLTIPLRVVAEQDRVPISPQDRACIGVSEPLFDS